MDPRRSFSLHYVPQVISVARCVLVPHGNSVLPYSVALLYHHGGSLFRLILWSGASKFVIANRLLSIDVH